LSETATFGWLEMARERSRWGVPGAYRRPGVVCESAMVEVIDVVRMGWRGSLGGMPTLVKDPPPAEFEALLERRRRLGQDRFDEVWEGVYVMNPAPSYEHQRVSQQLAELLGPLARAAGLEAVVGGVNLGSEESYRIQDASLHRPGMGGTYVPSAALVVEIVSPGDDTYAKLPFYAARQVDEVAIVDPQDRTVRWLGLVGGEYRPLERSAVVELGAAELARQINWP
jgi:Uma2 family endonuclease